MPMEIILPYITPAVKRRRLKKAKQAKEVKRELKKAYRLYEDFREEKPKRGRRIEFAVPKAVMIMGTVRAIDYDTTRSKKTELYRHEFAPGSRPLLCADGKTGQLFIIEGRYHVTDRGIVDLDGSGRELE